MNQKLGQHFTNIFIESSQQSSVHCISYLPWETGSKRCNTLSKVLEEESQWNSRDSGLTLRPMFLSCFLLLWQNGSLVALSIIKPFSLARNTKQEQDLSDKEKSKPQWKRQRSPQLQLAPVFIKSLEIDLQINIKTLYNVYSLLHGFILTFTAL